MKNNGEIIIFGILGLAIVLVIGKWFLDNKQCGPNGCVTPYQQDAYYPQYHNNNDFWIGYSDGWSNFLIANRRIEYNQGYQLGNHDRQLNHRYYYERYYPSGGFQLKVPGVQLRIDRNPEQIRGDLRVQEGNIRIEGHHQINQNGGNEHHHR